MLAYALGLSTFTSLLFGLAPAWSAARFDLVSSLKDDSAGSTARQRLRRVMIVGQVAICTALLVWSGLFLRSLRHIGDIDPGFDPSGVLLATIALEEGVVDDERGDRIFTEWARARDGLSWRAVRGAVERRPARADRPRRVLRHASGRRSRHAPPRGRQQGEARAGSARSGFRLLAGRDFTWDDRKGAPDVAIVNETLARQFWNGQAIGQRVNYGTPAPWRSSASCATASTARSARRSGRRLYLPVRQSYMSEITLHVRTTDMPGTRAVADA